MNSFISSLRNYPERKTNNKELSENKLTNINASANDNEHLGKKEIDKKIKSIELLRKYKPTSTEKKEPPNIPKVVSPAPDIKEESESCENKSLTIIPEESTSRLSHSDETYSKKDLQLVEEKDSLEDMSKGVSKEKGTLEKGHKKLNQKSLSLERNTSNEKLELVQKYKSKVEMLNSQSEFDSQLPKSKSQKLRETSSGEKSKKEHQTPLKSPSKKKYDNEFIENIPSRNEAVSMICKTNSLHNKLYPNEVKKKKSEKMLYKTNLHNPSYISQHNNLHDYSSFDDHYPAKHHDMKFMSRNITAHNPEDGEGGEANEDDVKVKEEKGGKKKCKDPADFLMEIMQGCLCKKLFADEFQQPQPLPQQSQQQAQQYQQSKQQLPTQKSRFSTYDMCGAHNSAPPPANPSPTPGDNGCCGELVQCLLKSLVAKGCCENDNSDEIEKERGKQRELEKEREREKEQEREKEKELEREKNNNNIKELDKIKNQQCCLEQEMNKLKSCTIVFLKEAMDKRAESKMLEMRDLMSNIEKKKQAYLSIVSQKLSNQEAELNQLRALQEENQAFICEQQQIINKQLEMFQEKEQAIRECADLQIEELTAQHRKDMESERTKLAEEMTATMLTADKNSKEKVEELQQKVIELTQEIQNQERMLQQVAADCQTKIFEQEQEFCQERMRFQAEMQDHIIQRRLLEQHACMLEKEKEKMEQEIKGLTSCDFDKLFKKACKPPSKNCKPSNDPCVTNSESCASTCSKDTSANDSQHCYKYPSAKSWAPEKSCEPQQSGLKCKLDLSQFKVPFHCRNSKQTHESKLTVSSKHPTNNSYDNVDECQVCSHCC